MYVFVIIHFGLFYSVAGSSNSLKVSDPKQHLTLALNTIQIIVLSIDSLVNLVGGVKGLISESCNIRSGKNNRRQLRFTEVRIK